LFIVEEEDSDEEDSVPVSKVEARVDMVLRSSRGGEEPQIILVLEHKRPGTLRKSDWVNPTHTLLFNAEEIAKQARKYLYVAVHNIAGIYDSTAVVGCKLDYRDMRLWHSKREIEMKVFFEDKVNNFLLVLIAMVTYSLSERKLISGWRW